MMLRTRKRSRAGAALGSRTIELGSGTPWAEADRDASWNRCGNKQRDPGLGFVESPARVRVFRFGYYLRDLEFRADNVL
ncbi:hypothetical protein F2Q69_00020658 [Brassica cretica]|uniref:Uncharacterized protein n=1 Tax=Brassica cretica TaxID=69181 RepID=A0A8S9Q1H4_BRACR|nr:hypothetical protein F2Q69_00020658 [Brassica cretica]